MASPLGRVRRALLAPGEASGAARRLGHHPSPRLERIPAAVVRGFRGTVDGSPLSTLADRAAAEPPDLRGFHHEGAVMAACVLDAMDPRPSWRARAVLTGAARAHVLLGWIGVGFALAKMPVPVRSRVVPALDDVDHQAVLSTLAVDGWAFDLAFFDPGRFVDRREPFPAMTWRGDASTVPAVADQGLGRALWFVRGGDPDEVASTVASFAASRRPDLWAGVGLAATLAGAGPGEVGRLVQLGDPDELALGAVLAAHAAREAETDTGVVPPHVVEGTRLLAGLSVEGASDLVRRLAPAPSAVAAAEYLQWRARIRAHVSSDLRIV